MLLGPWKLSLLQLSEGGIKLGMEEPNPSATQFFDECIVLFPKEMSKIELGVEGLW